MMDPITRDEAKASIVDLVTHKAVVRLEELASWYAGIIRDGLPPIQTLLAELKMEQRLTEKLFRVGMNPVQFVYFVGGTVEAHLLQKEMGQRVRFRPADFEKLSDEQRWDWDKALGILDYCGDE